MTTNLATERQLSLGASEKVAQKDLNESLALFFIGLISMVLTGTLIVGIMLFLSALLSRT